MSKEKRARASRRASKRSRRSKRVQQGGAGVSGAAVAMGPLQISRRVEEYDYVYPIRGILDRLQKLSPTTLGYPIRTDRDGDQNKAIFYGLSRYCPDPVSIQNYSLDDGYAFTVINRFIQCLWHGNPHYNWFKSLMKIYVPNPHAGTAGNFLLGKDVGEFLNAFLWPSLILDNINTLLKPTNFNVDSVGNRFLALYVVALKVGISWHDLHLTIPLMFERGGSFEETAFFNRALELLCMLPKFDKPQAIALPSQFDTLQQGISLTTPPKFSFLSTPRDAFGKQMRANIQKLVARSQTQIAQAVRPLFQRLLRLSDGMLAFAIGRTAQEIFKSPRLSNMLIDPQMGKLLRPILVNMTRMSHPQLANTVQSMLTKLLGTSDIRLGGLLQYVFIGLSV